MTKAYRVIIITPAGEDEFDYEVRVERNGVELGRINAPFVAAQFELGVIIMRDVASEEAAGKGLG